MVLTMVVNAIINKEKPTTKMLIGVAFAVVAIVFLNL
jgi:drug/metabolite transporter (DMT)-like permease